MIELGIAVTVGILIGMVVTWLIFARPPADPRPPIVTRDATMLELVAALAAIREGVMGPDSDNINEKLYKEAEGILIRVIKLKAVSCQITNTKETP